MADVLRGYCLGALGCLSKPLLLKVYNMQCSILCASYCSSSAHGYGVPFCDNSRMGPLWDKINQSIKNARPAMPMAKQT